MTFLRTASLALLGALAWSTAHAAEGGAHHGAVTEVLFSLAIILGAAKIAGEVAERLKQPGVLGELLCGMALGSLPLFGIDALAGLSEAPFLGVVAELGVILLLFEVGLESDLDELLAVGPSALLVALLGVLTPLVLGSGASWLFLAEGVPWYTHLFIGATLAATSVGITARVLQDLGRTKDRESKIILGAAIVDDILGLLVLSLMLGIVNSAGSEGAGQTSLAPILIKMAQAVGFLVVSVAVGRKLMVPLVSLVQKARSESMGLVLTIAYCFLMAALAEMAGLADIVGAFAAGLVVDETIMRHFGGAATRDRIVRTIHPLGAVFAPVFFVYMGLRVDLRVFGDTDLMVFAGVLSMVAVVSKQACSLGVLEKDLNRWAVGVGMIPRGEVGLIFAGIGSTVVVAGTPVLGAQAFSAVVAMVMLTTLVTPPLLKVVFGGATGSSDARLPEQD